MSERTGKTNDEGEPYSHPDPPDGYHHPERSSSLEGITDYVTTFPGLRIVGTGGLLALIAFWSVPFGLSTLREFLLGVSGDSVLIAVLVYVGGLIAISVVTIVVHERIHKLVIESYGYDVDIEYGFLLSFALVEEQWIKRTHNLPTLIAPFILISGVSILLCLTVPSQTLMIIFGAVFIINTSASCNDILNFIDLMKRPDGTLAWLQREGDLVCGYIYEPKT